MIEMMGKTMNLDEKKQLELPFVKRASDNDSWLRLMVTNPLNGVMSTFSNEIVELGKPEEAKSKIKPLSEAQNG
ncbi:MAG: hypothetical protein V1784_03885 [bacterium]